MRSWESVFLDKTRAVGEVAGVEAGKIDVFVYPESYPLVRVGSILVVDSEGCKPIGIVMKLAHTSHHGSIVPLRKTRQEIRSAYPDIERYYRYVSTIVYTSNVVGGSVSHVRASMPRLHDLVYLVDSKELLDSFFRPQGEWNFEFLRYYIAEGSGNLEVRELFYTHREFFMEYQQEKKQVISAIVNSLRKSGVSNIAAYLEDICDALGWR